MRCAPAPQARGGTGNWGVQDRERSPHTTWGSIDENEPSPLSGFPARHLDVLRGVIT